MSEPNPPKPNWKRYEFDQSVSSGLPVNKYHESPEYTISVKYIPSHVARQKIIDFANQFGTLAVEPHITQSTEKLRKMTFLTFTEQSAVERCMNGNRQTYKVAGYPVAVQRYLPLGQTFDRSYRVLLFLETSGSNCKLNENDIRNYFDTRYGPTKAFVWSSDKAATMDFHDYDSVDQAVLDTVVHTINGVNVRIEKVKSSLVRSAYEQTIAPHDIHFSVHVRNIPPHVSGEQLATIFNSNVWDIIIRKGIHPDTDPFEAWIMNIAVESDAEELATTINCIDGVDVQCNVESEPLNEWTLCNGNRDGYCKYGNNCVYRHVTCASGDGCQKEECPFSHTKQRKIKPNPRNRPPGPIEQQYRIKIDGVPYHMTAMQLLTELKKQPINLLKFIESPEVPEDSKTRHFYLVQQSAEKLARKRIYEWHDYPIREDYLVKCQLEYDRVTVTGPSSNLSATALQTENERLRRLFAPLSPGDDKIDGMPSQWIWTNRRLGKEMSDIYLIYPSDSTDDRLGVMKVYHGMNDLKLRHTKRELLALRTLENEAGVIPVYETNILDLKRKTNAPMWLITPMISEFTLEDYVDKHKSKITFHQTLLLTQQLLEIVQRCHKRCVLHRNLQPNNILVKQNNDPTSTDEIKIVLIGFSATWTDVQGSSITEEIDLRIIDQVIKRHSDQTSDHTVSNLKHLLSPASKSLCHNPIIDAASICRIWFWLLTDHWPEQVDYADNYPHYDHEYQQKINEKLGDAQSNTKLREQLMLVFDRTFRTPDHWWSVDELLDHLNDVNALFLEFESAQLNSLFPIATTTTLLPLNDPYARIVALIAHVKQQFAEQYATCLKWSDSSNKWSTKNKDIEVKNTDELIYHYQERQCAVSIIFSAKIDSYPLALFLGSVDENDIGEPKPLCHVTKETNDMHVSTCFENAVKKIIREKLKQANLSI